MTPETLNLTTLIAVIGGTATIVIRMATKGDLKELKADLKAELAKVDGRVDRMGERIEQFGDRQHADMMGVMGRDRDFDTRISKLEDAAKGPR